MPVDRLRFMDITRAKLRQAAELMQQHGLDCWIIEFARETGNHSDPLAYLVGAKITWPSAFLLNHDGRSAAIVGSGDKGQIEGLGLWDEVHGYVASPRDELVNVLRAWNPGRIGVTWSDSDAMSDGITYGMYKMLESLLDRTPYKERLVSAGALAGDVRSRKLPDEIEAIHTAISFTEQVFQRIATQLKPGLTEIQLQRSVQSWIREAGHGFAWEDRMNPIIDFGPKSEPLGHSIPGETKLEPGHLAHVDLGITVDGFSSDLQRTWYLLRDGETDAPDEVKKAFTATRQAIDAGMAVLKPGNAGHEVDAESRRTIIEAGFPEPQFAFGHHVGRVAHDGAGTLGPRWERYGKTPEIPIQADNVFAVEMDLDVPGYGIIGLEEEAVVEGHGARFLSNPQRELWLLKPR